MDNSIIDAAAATRPAPAPGVFGGVAAVAVLAGVVFARAITRPIIQLVRIAERVGQGDLSETVPVHSRDEIGQLADTFNDSIVRLRSLVQTEAERDEEKRKREDLQRNITRFLDTVIEVSQGDLTRRGEVTSDVLGNVVDSINVMVEEIATILATSARPRSACPASAQRDDRRHGADGQRRPGPVARGHAA